MYAYVLLMRILSSRRRYWDLRVQRSGDRHPHDGVLNYSLARSYVDVKTFDKPLPLMECRNQANNTRAKFEDTLKNLKDNNTQYDYEVSAERVERRHPHLSNGNNYHALERDEQMLKEIKRRKKTRDREVIQENGKANKRTCKTLQSKEDQPDNIRGTRRNRDFEADTRKGINRGTHSTAKYGTVLAHR
jgi:hypothetical protein